MKIQYKHISQILPNATIKLANLFLDSGFKLYLIGGSIRDILLDKIPNDFDFTTQATPSNICEILKDYKLITIGAKYGTIGVVIDGIHCEITTFRSDCGYNDNRHPNSVIFENNIDADLKRRDFTINAIAYDIIDNKIIDNHNGIYDLKNSIVRTIGNPRDRFNEDGLRILRAFAFCSTLNFTIHNETLKAIIEQKKLLENIKCERIRNEIKKIIHGINSYKTLILMQQHNILPLKPIPKRFDKIPLCYRIYASFCIFDNMDFFNPTLKKKIITIQHICQILDSTPFKAKDKKILLNTMAYKFGTNNLEIAINIQCALKKAHLKRYFKPNHIKKLLKLHINGDDLINENILPKDIQKVKNHLLSQILCYKIKNDRFLLLKYIRSNKTNLIDSEITNDLHSN